MHSDKIATPEEMAELVSGVPSTDPSWFLFDDVELGPADIVAILGPYLTPERAGLIERVLDQRTESVAVVVEGMVDLGNVGAVMRSADGFGIHQIHAIDTAGAYKRSRRTSQGADKWLDRYRWENVEECVEHLRRSGFAIIAADPAPGAVTMADVDLTASTAMVFGNELEGITEEMRSLADQRVSIPMSGFAASFNISVAAALVLHEVQRQRIVRFGSNGDLTPDRRGEIRAVWYLKSVRAARLVVERAIADGYRPEAT